MFVVPIPEQLSVKWARAAAYLSYNLIYESCSTRWSIRPVRFQKQAILFAQVVEEVAE